MKRLKIIISNYDNINNPFYSGGGAVAFHEIGKRLSKDHDVTILCGAYIGAKDKVIDGVSYVHVGIPTGPMLGQAEFALLLPYYMKKSTYDIWLESFLPPHSTTMLQLFTKKPVIGITTILNASEFSRKYHLPFTVLESTGLHFYRHIIATSDEMKDQILRTNPHANIVVIPNGIDKSLLKREPTERPTIVFMGRIDIFQKGLDILIAAWKEFIKTNPTYNLTIMGDGTSADEKRLRTLIKEYDVEKSVDLIGRKLGKEKEKILSSATAVVFPSRFETFGISVLESLALGKPIIVSDIEGYKWIPSSIGIKIISEDISSLTTQLSKIVNDKKLRNKLSKNAKLFSKNFTWDEIAKRYQTVIESVASISSL